MTNPETINARRQETASKILRNTTELAPAEQATAVLASTDAVLFDGNLIPVIAERISDLLVQLGVNPDERPEHGGASIAETLAGAALGAIKTTTRP